jgi:hypothetical protein
MVEIEKSYPVVIHASLPLRQLKVSSRQPNLYTLFDVLRSIGKNDFGVVDLLGADVSLS